MPRHGVNFTSPRPWNADATEMLPTPVSHRYREHDETRNNVSPPRRYRCLPGPQRQNDPLQNPPRQGHASRTPAATSRPSPVRHIQPFANTPTLTHHIQPVAKLIHGYPRTPAHPRPTPAATFLSHVLVQPLRYASSVATLHRSLRSTSRDSGPSSAMCCIAVA